MIGIILLMSFILTVTMGCVETGMDYWWNDVCLENGEGIRMPWFECSKYCHDNCKGQAKAWVWNPDRNGGSCWCKTKLANPRPRTGQDFYAGAVGCWPNPGPYGCVKTGMDYWWNDVCLENGEGIRMPWHQCSKHCHDNCKGQAKAWVWNPDRNGGSCWCKTKLANPRPRPGQNFYAGSLGCWPNVG